MKRLLVLLFTCSTCFLAAQENFSIRPLFDINSGRSELASAYIAGHLFVTSSTAESAGCLAEKNVSCKASSSIWKRGADFSDWSSLSSYFPSRWKMEGTFSIAASGDRVFFSSRKNFGGAKGNHAKLYTCQRIDGKWGTPEMLSVNMHSSDCIHPCFDEESHVLVFSSNRAGGMGGMDLWFCVLTENGWTEPLNLGLGVNSSANEVFPCFFKGDIFYSTNAADTWGGYDIRRALARTQWKTAIAEGAPFNSAADDMSLLFLDQERAVLTSNRAGGMGGDDLFLLTRIPAPSERHEMTAQLSCGDCVLSGVKLTVVNSDNGLVQTLSTDENGSLDISSLRIGQAYEIRLDSALGKDFSRCRLIVNDADGNRYLEVGFSERGSAFLELLPFLLSRFSALNEEDYSLLNLDLEGQLYADQPGDIGMGEPITILNSRSEPVAIAYTNDKGKFRFTKLDPQLKYVMRLSDESEAQHAIITDKGRRIDIPVLEAEINYSRVSTENAISLVNENNDTIHISTEDLFVINRIYYGYNSAQLTLEALRQLEQLAVIMERNPGLALELRSHTDSRGEFDYNLKLSEQRAKSAIDFLIGQGLEAARFQSKGCGETELLNECRDGILCSEPEHAINRRTEIRFKRQGAHEAYDH